MGCLPLPLGFLLGVGIGYAAGGTDGALWGAAAGLLLGGAGMAWLIRAMRGKR